MRLRTIIASVLVAALAVVALHWAPADAIVMENGLLTRHGHSVAKEQPAFDHDFTLHGFGADLAITRATVGTCHNSTGVLTTFSSGDPRLPCFFYDGSNWINHGLLIEPARTNDIQNNTMVGASAGTPGTLPTRWVNMLQGTTREVVGTGTTNGIEWVDLRLSGTPASAPYFGFESTTGIVAADGEDWSESAYVALVGGDFTGVTGIKLWQVERTAGGGFVQTNKGADFKGSLTSTLQRFTFSTTLSGGGTVARVQPALGFDVNADIDITLRIGVPEEEEGAFATSVIKTTNAGAVTRNADEVTVSDVTWFNRTEGTFVVGFSRPAYTFNEPVVAIQVDGVASSGIEINAFTGGSRVDYGRASGQDTLDTGVSPVADTQHDLVFAFAADDLQAAGDGALGNSDSDTAGELTDAGTDIFNLGMGEGITRTEATRIQRVTFYNRRVANDHLQNLAN